MKQVCILGSTGSIGLSTLRVIREFKSELQVVALAAGRNLELLAEQICEFRPRLVSVHDPRDVQPLGQLLDGRLTGAPAPEILAGVPGMCQVVTESGAGVVITAVSGSPGLLPTMAALQAGKQLALATKEVLVMAGQIVMQEAQRQGTEILPVDSEHNAIHQCLRGENRHSLRRLILTASGGPFRDTPIEQFAAITPQLALCHPTWRMGRKITIDSATMMNKGLEVIEAHWLFGVPAADIQVLVHPQSTVHSMVEFIDGSVIAQLGITDMRHAIQYALLYPRRCLNSLPPLDLAALQHLDFAPPDTIRFPCLQLAYAALQAGGTMPAVLNAANELAVDAFLAGRIPFTSIARLIEAAMQAHQPRPQDSLSTILAADAEARQFTCEYIQQHFPR